MIEPTDMKGSTSVKKFTSPVCGQRSFDSIVAPSRYAHCRQNEREGQCVPISKITNDIAMLRMPHNFNKPSGLLPGHRQRMKMTRHHP
jgi:hypothetical protein